MNRAQRRRQLRAGSRATAATSPKVGRLVAKMRAGAWPGDGDLERLLTEAATRSRDPVAEAKARGVIAAVRQFRQDLGERSGSRERLIQRSMAEMHASGRYGV